MISRYLILLLIIPGAFAFTIAPSTIEYDFVPGGNYQGNICIIGGEGKLFNLELDSNNIIDKINISSEFIPSKYYDCQDYILYSNYFVNERKEYELLLAVKEVNITAESESGIRVITRIAQKIVIDATDAPVREDAPKMGVSIVIIALGIFILALLTLSFIRRKRN